MCKGTRDGLGYGIHGVLGECGIDGDYGRFLLELRKESLKIEVGAMQLHNISLTERRSGLSRRRAFLLSTRQE